MLVLTIAFALFLALGATPVVVSSDTGCEMDDQWAIAHLAISPSIKLRAVVTTHAPGMPQPSAESTAKVARAVLAHLPEDRRPPVVAGSSTPLRDRSTPNRNPGVDRLIAESKDFNSHGRLTIVVIGPATDIASALLIDPTIADRVRVVSMAFERWPEGGDPFNVRNDVAAWQVLMDSKVPLTVVDGEVCMRRLTLTRTQAKAKLACRSSLADDLVAALNSWLDRQPKLAQSITGSADSWPVWDEGTTAILLGFATVETRPRPHLRDDRTFDHTRSSGTIDWVTDLDGDRLWSDLATRLRPSP